MKVIAPIRCPICRNRLTTRGGRRGPFPTPIKWCKRCKHVVTYVTEDEDLDATSTD